MNARTGRRSPTRRQKWRRSRRGQVAAIATIFGLMLVVTFIAEFVIAPLPTQEQNQEFQHTLLVENQVGAIQSAIMAGASRTGVPLTAVEPVTLGSQGLPPFGQAAPGQLTLFPTGTGVTVSLPTLTGPPSWGVGGLCNGGISTTGNKTTCTFTINACQPSETWNVSLSHQTYYFLITGNSAACPVINVTGDWNAITLNITDNNMVPPLNFTLYGSHNNVTVNWEGGSGSTLNFNLFGSYNTYRYGTSFNGKGANIVTRFIGELEPQGTTGCPYGTLDSTDKVRSLVSVSSGDSQKLIFYHSTGATNSHGPIGTLPAITWQNVTQSPSRSSCAFGSGVPTGLSLPLVGAGALTVLLQNNYLQDETVALEGGAVFAGVAGAPSVLVDPPPFTFTALPTGLYAQLTLISLLGHPPTEQGYSNAGVQTSVVGNSTTTLTVGTVVGHVTIGPPQLTITTKYPQGWASYLTTLSNFTSGPTNCTSTVTFQAPYTCLQPPAGAIVTLSVTLNVVTFTVTSLLVKVVFY